MWKLYTHMYTCPAVSTHRAKKKTVIIYLVCIHTVIYFNHFSVDATSLRLIQGLRKVCKQLCNESCLLSARV